MHLSVCRVTEALNAGCTMRVVQKVHSLIQLLDTIVVHHILSHIISRFMLNLVNMMGDKSSPNLSDFYSFLNIT